jgi:hypothetical protein
MDKDLSFEIKIDISTEKIVGNLSLDDTSISLNNIAVIDRKDKYVVAVGKNLTEYKSDFLEEQEVSDSGFDTLPIFDYNNFHPEISASITLSLINSLLKHLKPTLNHQPIVYINFLNYDKVDLILRNDFEFLIAKFARLKRLLINNQESQATYKKTVFLQLSYLASFLLAIFSMILLDPIFKYISRYLGLGELSTVLDWFVFTLVGFMPFIVFIACGLFTAEFLWMFFMRFFFPKQILRNTILYFYSPLKLKINPISSISHRLLLIDKE